MAEIMDVSRWQGSINWDAVKRSGKIDGVMLRVLGSKGGKPYVDPAFKHNYAECPAGPARGRLLLHLCGHAAADGGGAGRPQNSSPGQNVPAAPCNRCGGPPACAPWPPQSFRPWWPKPLPNSKRGGCMQWCTPTPISRIPPSTWQPSLLTICGSRTTAARAPPASTGCGSTPAAAPSPA